MAAFTFLAVKRMHREAHSDLSLMALANSGDNKEVNKQLDAWEKDCA
jgi:hypothetical protein